MSRQRSSKEKSGQKASQRLSLPEGSHSRMVRRSKWAQRSSHTDVNYNSTVENGSSSTGRNHLDSRATTTSSNVILPAMPPACTTCVVFNNDPRIIYGGSWNLSGSGFSTVHSTVSDGANVTFKFNGSGIMVFGIIPASNEKDTPPTAVYIVDKQDPFPTTAPTALKSIVNQPLFAASNLPDREHKFVINVTNAVTPFTLQSFFVIPQGNWTQDVALPSNSISTSSVKATRTTSTVRSPTSSAAASAAARQEDISDVRKAVMILGGLLGTLVVLAIIGGGVYIIRRRARQWRIFTKNKNAKSESTKSSRETMTTAFTSTESILRADRPSMFWSNYSRSEASSPLPPAPPPKVPPLPDYGDDEK